MPPPSKPRPPTIERGGGDSEDDPERLQGTQQKVPLSRGGKAALGDDPERHQRTEAKVKPPVSRGRTGELADDPERLQGTQQKLKVPEESKVSRGGDSLADDPERVQSTSQMRAPGSPRRTKPKKPGRPSNWEVPVEKSAEPEDEVKDPDYETGNAYAPDEDAPDYQTGNDYQPIEGSREMNLEGDGLEALDADLGPPKTQALEALDQALAESEEPGAAPGEDDNNATRAGPPLSLEITAGPDAGKKKKFRGVRMVIGRTPGVDLQLSDQSVSRRHVELVQGDNGVLLRDLGSGNGTKVNEEKVAEKVLEHGDEIHIGKTKMRFVDEMAAFKKLREQEAQKEEEEKKAAEEAEKKEAEAPAEGAEGAGEGDASEAQTEAADAPKTTQSKTGASLAPDRTDRKPVARRGAEPPAGLVGKFKALEPAKRLLVLGAAGALMIFLLLMIALSGSPPPKPVDPKKELAAQKMQLAREAVRAGRYEDAIALIDGAELLSPGVDTTKLAATARAEVEIKKSLDAIKPLLAENRFDDVRTELARIPAGSIKAEEEKAKVEAELKASEHRVKVSKIMDLVAAGELETAKQQYADSTPELSPAELSEIAGKIADAEAQAEDLKKQEERDARQRRAEAEASTKNRAAESMSVAFASVQRKFAGNDWERAAIECERVMEDNLGSTEIHRRAKLLQQLIPNFGRNYEEGTKKFRDGQISSAAKPLRLARNYYQQINLPTKLGAEIDEKLAQAAVMAGKEALLRDDLASAAVNFRDAVKLDPTDGRAKAGLDDVVSKAEELYQLAYMMRDNDPAAALRKFKVVLEVTPPGSAVHEKVKNLIAAMQP
jgi:pSer/pThr/pTyr-binding forkhead associated (FHA) protein